MNRQTLTSFILFSGLGATILTIFILTEALHYSNFADNLNNRNQQQESNEYTLNHWHRDVIFYGGTTVELKHKVVFDHNKNQYRYDYVINYIGSKNVLMRWEILDEMRSSDEDSSCILELKANYPHNFTMWSQDPPMRKEGKVQLYNNLPNTKSWNYWQCNQTDIIYGPVPSSDVKTKEWVLKQTITIEDYPIIQPNINPICR